MSPIWIKINEFEEKKLDFGKRERDHAASANFPVFFKKHLNLVNPVKMSSCSNQFQYYTSYAILCFIRLFFYLFIICFLSRSDHKLEGYDEYETSGKNNRTTD